MMIDGAEFIADITGCSAWTTWADGVIILWSDRAPQYFTRGEDGSWNGEPIEPPTIFPALPLGCVARDTWVNIPNRYLFVHGTQVVEWSVAGVATDWSPRFYGKGFKQLVDELA